MSQGSVARNRERYDRSFALLDDVRARVMAVLHAITQPQADTRPADTEWSIGEIADHLAITERAYAGVVAELAAHAKPHEFEYHEIVKNRPFRIEDTWNTEVTGKLPTPSELLPTRGKRLGELIQSLRDARSDSRRILGGFRDADLGVKFFVHPRLGIMTLYERIEQLAYHELKHLRQMERVLSRLSSSD
jgi:hypothetical protein